MKKTKDRKECGIPEHKAGDKTISTDPNTKQEREYTFVKETIIKDEEGYIIGVQTEWQ